MDPWQMRVPKYLIIGWAVALACLAIPKQRLAFEEVAMISLVGAATYSIVDTYLKSQIKI
jgi:hypothetical protein